MDLHMTIILSLNNYQENLKYVLNAEVKIQKNILLSLYLLIKNMTKLKQLKNSTKIVKALKNNMVMVKRLQNPKQLHTA